ncbi:MAG: hypothetical protein KDK25_04760 [Leptospiraceae bacterium]|nr:hypothetical protein [Leptospiraceae bacterium]
MRGFSAFCAAALIVVSGSYCASASAGITTSNIPLTGKNYRVVGSGEASVDWWALDIGILGLPLEEPPVDKAIKQLLDEHGGDALINMRYSTDRYVFLFMTRYKFTLRADVVKVN